MFRSQKSKVARFITAPLLGVVAAAFVTSTASAQTILIKTEFNEDDQPGFDIWPGGIGGSLMTNVFGGITVDVSTSTGFAQPTDRGSTNGNPPGYTYQNLYEDLLHAFSATGTMTFDFSGLQPNAQYTFTLYAWDPGQSSGTHEWSVTGGTGVPSVITVDWSAPLVDNETFALVFNITTTAAGTFQVDNTAGLAQSAVNGFILSGGSIGTNYCDPSVVNSTGLGAQISAAGSDTAIDNDLTLTCSQLPQGQFAFFLNSLTQGFVANPGVSQGNLCVVGSIGGYNANILNSGAIGEVSLALDLANTPTPTGRVAIMVGETWNFQCWYRDLNPQATSNFSDGLSITFQ